jgi:GntR family transcriptional regulator, transcriptional repressor for pyruvate dehydrogenase complex
VRFAPVIVRRASDEVTATIADAIWTGDLRAGDHLPSERDLAAQMKVSRPTVREALRRLVDGKIIEVRPGSSGGAIVINDRVPRQLLGHQAEFSEHDIVSLLQARRLLEPRVAQLAAANGEEADFQAIAETIERQRQLAHPRLRPEDEEFFLQIGLQFHLLIARASRNTTVVDLTRKLIRDLDVARSTAIREPSAPEWVIDIHTRTLGAIRSRNLELVETVMDEHLAFLERTWEHVSDRPLIHPVPSFLRPMAGTGSGPLDQ